MLSWPPATLARSSSSWTSPGNPVGSLKIIVPMNSSWPLQARNFTWERRPSLLLPHERRQLARNRSALEARENGQAVITDSNGRLSAHQRPGVGAHGIGDSRARHVHVMPRQVLHAVGGLRKRDQSGDAFKGVVPHPLERHHHARDAAESVAHRRLAAGIRLVAICLGRKMNGVALARIEFIIASLQTGFASDQLPEVVRDAAQLPVTKGIDLRLGRHVLSFFVLDTFT